MRGGCGDGAGRSDGSDVCAVCYTVPNMLRFFRMSPRAVALCACAATVYGFTARAAPRPRRLAAGTPRCGARRFRMVAAWWASEWHVLLVLLTGA